MDWEKLFVWENLKFLLKEFQIAIENLAEHGMYTLSAMHLYQWRHNLP